MYTHAGLLLAFSQGYSQDLLSYHHPLFSLPHDQLLPINNPNLGSIVQNSAVLEYDLGGEGDLFKAPEPIIGESVLALDPITSGMSLISSDADNVITAETIQVADMESIQIEHLDDVINGCKNDFLAKSLTEETIPEHEVAQHIDEEDSEKAKSRMVAEGGQMQKSVSSGSLKSMEWINACCNRRPNFLSFEGLDFGAALGMRRAFSEGDMQTLGGHNYTSYSCIGVVHSYKSEERREKLSRYRRKKSLRNFNRKIKYACRKALADNQPRVRGRFAKTEDR